MDVESPKLLTRLAILLSGGVGRQILNFAAVFLAAGVLPKDHFGLFSFAQSLVLISIVVGDGGLRTYLWKRGSVCGVDKSIYSAGIASKILMSSIVSLALLVFLETYPGLSVLPVEVLCIICLVVIFNPLLIDWVYRANKNDAVVSVLNIAVASILLFGTVVAIMVSALTLQMMLVLFSIAHLIPVLTMLVMTAKQFDRRAINMQGVFQTFAAARAYWPNVILGRLVVHAPIIITGLLLPAASVGEFKYFHLLYALAVSLAIYPSALIFNQLAVMSAISLEVPGWWRWIVVLLATFILACVYPLSCILQLVFPGIDAPFFIALAVGVVCVPGVLNAIFREVGILKHSATHLATISLSQMLLFCVALLVCSRSFSNGVEAVLAVVFSELVMFVLLTKSFGWSWAVDFREKRDEL